MDDGSSGEVGRPRVFTVITGSQLMLYPFRFAPLSDAEANTLRLEMLQGVFG